MVLVYKFALVQSLIIFILHVISCICYIIKTNNNPLWKFIMLKPRCMYVGVSVLASLDALQQWKYIFNTSFNRK
jgi:hypothetical protein